MKIILLYLQNRLEILNLIVDIIQLNILLFNYFKYNYNKQIISRKSEKL